MQTAAKSSHHSPPHSCPGANLNVKLVLRHKRLCSEKLNNNWILLFVIHLLPHINNTVQSFSFLFFVRIFTFHLLKPGGHLVVGTHILDELNSPKAVSV